MEENDNSNLESIGSVDVKIEIINENKIFKKIPLKTLKTIYISKSNLGNIKELTGLNIIANEDEIYDELWDKIFEADQLIGIKKSIQSPCWINYMYSLDKDEDKEDIKQTKQNKGDIYIVIQVVPENEIWEGMTSRLKVTLS